MGKPVMVNAVTSMCEYIVHGGERGELKHLSTPGRESKNDFLSSGERTGKSPNHVLPSIWGCRTAIK